VDPFQAGVFLSDAFGLERVFPRDGRIRLKESLTGLLSRIILLLVCAPLFFLEIRWLHAAVCSPIMR